MRTLSTCTDCGAVWEKSQGVCGDCESSNRSIDTFETSLISITEESKLLGRHGEPGEVRPHLEVTSRRRFNRDRQRHENVLIIVNSETDEYQQVWTDDDGNITFEKRGSLRDPTMHGRASYRPTGRAAEDESTD